MRPALYLLCVYSEFGSSSETRHSCEQGDELKAYGWTEHDLRHGGAQVLNDTLNNLQLTTEWLKIPGGETGGSWAARIKGRPLLPGKASPHLVTQSEP